ncbi:HD domain-containing protein [Eggerthellaceae bacterium zg-887]|uniref:CCA tRNA nucleotidyltransferase n=1 Tax=Xiamenia xianingshaonis TaxID=2682776 RepID=UPI00140AF138|nr:HD domain-containing protein [Xiamenia xianingshaonis]NHM17038.1 HD domain-containing protein [Xiamenia xianingshaonis]
METERLAPFALPRYAEDALRILEGAGHEAWVVGGFVRDAIMHRPCADIDIASSAPWQEVQRLFEDAGWRTRETGCKHGTITVIREHDAIEVTTFRCDGAYLDARHPDEVTFVRSIEEDLARRDFTMNALAYHPERGLLDPYGGLGDIEASTIRTVGEADKRFSEDALRMLRGCRFASELDFSIEPETFAAMVRNKGLLGRIAVERVRAELDRLLVGPAAGRVLVNACDAIAAVLPEVVAMKGFEQHTPYHIYDVLEHTARAIDGTAPRLRVRWATLLHDMGKPATFFRDENGRGHFYGHPAVSVAIGRGLLERMLFSSADRDRILALVRWHDDVVPPTPRSVKRLLRRLDGDVELFCDLCELKRGDARGQAPEFSAERIALADALEATLADVLASDEAFSLKQLAVGGSDVLAAGIPQGPAVGSVLEDALQAVIDGEIANDRDALLDFVHRWRDQAYSHKFSEQ